MTRSPTRAPLRGGRVQDTQLRPHQETRGCSRPSSSPVPKASAAAPSCSVAHSSGVPTLVLCPELLFTIFTIKTNEEAHTVRGSFTDTPNGTWTPDHVLVPSPSLTIHFLCDLRQVSQHLGLTLFICKVRVTVPFLQDCSKHEMIAIKCLQQCLT